MAWNTEEEARVQAIEGMLNTIQIALNQVATRQEYKALTLIFQRQVDDLTSLVNQMELTGSGNALAAHITEYETHEAVFSNHLTTFGAHEVEYEAHVVDFDTHVADEGAHGGGGPGGGATGWVRVADVTPQGGGDIVDNKVYQDTGNTILQSCRSSSLSVNVLVRSSFPKITIESTTVFLPIVADDGHYEGNVAVTLAAAGDITVTCTTPDDNTGAVDTFALTLAAPPALLTLSFTGNYPGSQTQVKAGDTFQVTGTTDKDIDAIQVLNQDAGTSQLIPVAVGQSFTASITIANRGTSTQALAAHIQARDATTGSLGPVRATDELGGTVDKVDLVNLNNLYPTNSIGSVSYPGIQQALKNTEQATIPVTAADYDSFVVDSPNGQLTIVDDTPPSLTVQRFTGNYNITVNNLRTTATRNANGAVTIDQDIVRIAHVAAVATASHPGSRVRSGPAPGNDTTVTLSFDQSMLGAPSMDPAAGRGTFTGPFTGGGSSWSAALRVPDSENPATGASHAWLNLVATNLAGIVTNTITTGPTYVIGGFTTRTINFAPFTANSTETFPLTDESKLSAGVFSNGNPAVVQPFGTSDTTDVGKEGWCAPTAASGLTVKMRMLHSPTVAANSGGLTLTLVEETA
jgi:hypothetical protein